MKPFRLSLAQEYEGRLGEGASIYVAYSVEGALRIEALLKGPLNYLEITEYQLTATTSYHRRCYPSTRPFNRAALRSPLTRCRPW
jgi:hypothetical protein